MLSHIFSLLCPGHTVGTAQRSSTGYPRRTVLASLALVACAEVPARAQSPDSPVPDPHIPDPPVPDPHIPDPHIIVVFGDSQAEGLAAGLRRVSHQFPGTKIQNRTKAGTAISQPEKYDWPAVIQDYVPDPAVTTVVLMFGGNDRLPMHPATGPAIPFRAPAWNTAYRGEVAAILHSLAEKKLRVIWVSQPICQEPRYSHDMEYLNTIFREEIASGTATFLDIWTAIADGDQYAAYGKTLGGVTARLRLDDGIHFTPSGYDILATRVMQAIETSPDEPR
jgi:hypothetical protein